MADKSIKHRDVVMNSVKRILEYVKRADQSTSVEQLKVRLEKLEDAYKSILATEELLCKYPDVESKLEVFEDMYYEARARLQDLIPRVLKSMILTER